MCTEGLGFSDASPAVNFPGQFKVEIEARTAKIGVVGRYVGLTLVLLFASEAALHNKKAAVLGG